MKIIPYLLFIICAISNVYAGPIIINSDNPNSLTKITTKNVATVPKSTFVELNVST